uniref:Uncharacterized protein n=1 Tax=Romanomermis culicivorax TaxID=13658 RepID=A0A915KK74_ROMCU
MESFEFCRLEKLKRAGDEQKEAYLLQKLLNVIEEKSRLVESCVAEDTMNRRKVDVNDKSDTLSSENLSELKEEKKHATTKKLIKSRLKTLRKKILPNKS